jgi:NAD-dependent deacetylase
VTLITQNVDGLHRAAGSSGVLELHGDVMRSFCIDCRAPAETPDPGREESEVEPPRCGRCGGFIRPGVVWFGEMLPVDALERAQASARSADVMLVVGTSGVVWPAAELPAIAHRAGAALLEVNPARSEITPLTDIFLEGSAGAILPPLVAAVRQIRARE